jgi:hypothetical protein
MTTYTGTPAYKPPRWMDTVSRVIEISAGDVLIEMTGEYCATDRNGSEPGELIVVEINGRRVSWQNVDAALKLLGCYDEHRHWSDGLDEMTLNRLIAEQNIQADIDRAYEREGK